MTETETAETTLDANQAEAILDHCKQLFLGFLRDNERDLAINSIHAVAVLILEQLQGNEPVACTGGCSYCCHRPVLVTMPEADVIARSIALLPSDERMVLERKIRATARTLPSERVIKGLHPDNACPLLGEDGHCAVYDIRPLACRAASSFSVGSCRDHYEQRGDGGFDDNQGAILAVELIRQAINAALDEHKGQQWAEIYELVSAVDVLMD